MDGFEWHRWSSCIGAPCKWGLGHCCSSWSCTHCCHQSVRQSHYQCSGTKQHATPISTKRYYAITNMTYIDYILIRYAIRSGISINVATGEIHHRAPRTILPSPSRSGRAPLVEPHPSPPGHTQSPCKPGWHMADPGHPLPWWSADSVAPWFLAVLGLSCHFGFILPLNPSLGQGDLPKPVEDQE